MTERQITTQNNEGIVVYLSKLHSLIHYVELDKMNNERKNVERSLCYHNNISENLICFNISDSPLCYCGSIEIEIEPASILSVNGLMGSDLFYTLYNSC